jgi:hypothetical protein
MTEIRINGGASVHRTYEDGGAEFLACFQYEGDAKDFAERQVASDTQRGWLSSFYIISNHYDGNLTIVRPVKAEVAKESA